MPTPEKAFAFLPPPSTCTLLARLTRFDCVYLSRAAHFYMVCNAQQQKRLPFLVLCGKLKLAFVLHPGRNGPKSKQSNRCISWSSFLDPVWIRFPYDYESIFEFQLIGWLCYSHLWIFCSEACSFKPVFGNRTCSHCFFSPVHFVCPLSRQNSFPKFSVKPAFTRSNVMPCISQLNGLFLSGSVGTVTPSLIEIFLRDRVDWVFVMKSIAYQFCFAASSILCLRRVRIAEPTNCLIRHINDVVYSSEP